MERKVEVGASIREKSPWLDSARILVVEDEVVIAMDLQALLEDHGAQVVGPAYTLSVALGFATGIDISAAVLDLRLGREPISPVARILAARRIPFLFYSGQAASDPLRAEWPNSIILSKPARSREIIETVALLLKNRAP